MSRTDRFTTTEETVIENIPVDTSRPRIFTSVLRSYPKLRIWWTNDENTDDHPAFSAVGFVSGYAMDGEERDCLMFTQRDYPGFDFVSRSVVISQLREVEVLATSPLDQKCSFCGERNGHVIVGSYRCNACGEYS